MASYGAIALAGAVPPRRSPGLALVALALCAVAAVAALASWVQVCVCACVFCVACTRLASAGPDSPARPAPPAPARDAPPAPPALQAQPVALEQFEIVPLGGFRGGRPMMGLFLGDDAAKNLPEARVFETDGVSARARAIAGRAAARLCGCGCACAALLAVHMGSCRCWTSSLPLAARDRRVALTPWRLPRCLRGSLQMAPQPRCPGAWCKKDPFRVYPDGRAEFGVAKVRRAAPGALARDRCNLGACHRRARHAPCAVTGVAARAAERQMLTLFLRPCLHGVLPLRPLMLQDFPLTWASCDIAIQDC